MNKNRDTFTTLDFSIRLFAVCILFCFYGCKENEKSPKIEKSIFNSQWYFSSEPSCVDITDDGTMIMVGSEDGLLYVIKNENVRKYIVNRGIRILKSSYLGKINNLDVFLVSYQFNGISIIAIDNNDKLKFVVPVIMDDHRLPRKKNRYTAYDWVKDNDGIYYFATTNGLWKATLNIKDIYSKSELYLNRVSNKGVNQIQYCVSSIAKMDNVIYFTSEDGLWKYDKKIIKRISSDKDKYDCLMDGYGKLTAVSINKILSIGQTGEINETDNSTNNICLQVQVDKRTYFGFKRNLMLIRGVLKIK